MARKNGVSVLITLMLAMLLLLQGCRYPDIPIEGPQVTGSPPAVASPAHDIPVPSPAQPGHFTIRYVQEDTVNPITCMTRDNIVLSSLLYESLFTLDGNLNIEPVLCESWSTEDNITFKFIIKDDIAMNDGSLLTADDVVYTLRQAMQTGRFVNRLSTIRSVTSDEDLEVTVVLNTENNRFIRLLDIPIIKYGSVENHIPPGTGPYTFSGAGDMRLVRFFRHRDYTRLPLSEIRLLECDDNELAELFDVGVLSLLWDDPSDTFDIILNRHNEPRFYDTTSLQYIGYNARSIALRDIDVRRAIGSSLNRQYIIENIMPGQSVASPLALPPAYRLYSTQWEQTVVDPLIEMSWLFRRAGLEDNDNDSFLEYPDSYGGFLKISLDFIVNSDNTYKVRTAHRIADTLRLYGIEVIVRELPWERYLSALRTGDFDMYYGEVSLGPDFDLSPLLLPDNHLDFGMTGSDFYKPYIDAFMSAQTDYEERVAAERLCEEIRLNAPFVPILYKRYVVYTHIAAVAGATPSQTGVFNNFADWVVDLTMMP